jgi:hypothetical protein
LQENTMNMNTVFIRAAIATAMVGVGLASFDVPQAAAQDASAMSVETRAPLHATLLPTVTVVGNTRSADVDTSATVASNDALPVTLMPTVYVRASLTQLIARESNAIAARAEAAAIVLPSFAPIEVDSATAPLVLRVRSMPR